MQVAFTTNSILPPVGLNQICGLPDQIGDKHKGHLLDAFTTTVCFDGECTQLCPEVVPQQLSCQLSLPSLTAHTEMCRLFSHLKLLYVS